MEQCNVAYICSNNCRECKENILLNIYYICVCVCLSVVFSWVFLYEKAYQTKDTGIESAVMTKVKGFGRYSNQVMDVADYVVPQQVSY